MDERELFYEFEIEIDEETSFLIQRQELHGTSDYPGEPLDGDEVDQLVEHIRNKLNIREGNITEKEFEELEERK